jgi:HD domain
MAENLTTKQICPGQDTRFWGPGDIFEVDCAACGTSVEFFKDDARRKCPKCRTVVSNPRISLGCAQWCEHAKECLGYDPKAQDDEVADRGSLTDELVAAMKLEFGPDEKRIDHALSVLQHARALLKEEGGDPKIVMAAAVLHDIGITVAEEKHGSNSSKYQEIEGPPIAKRILTGLGMDPGSIDHVCEIIANHHSDGGIDTPEFRVIWDADWLVNMAGKLNGASPEKIAEKIDRIFKTPVGKEKARELFL